MLEGFVGVLSKVFGSKHERDVKELQPTIDTILEIEQTLLSISNDELRAKTFEFKKRIQDKIQEKEQARKELKERADSDVEISIQEKEELYTQIDNLEKEIV